MGIEHTSLSLESQLLTPKKLAWVMDAGETTVSDWIARREIPHFRMGRLIRFHPSAVLEFIVRRTVRAGGRSQGSGVSGQLPDEAWQRIERLIALAVASKAEIGNEPQRHRGTKLEFVETHEPGV